MSTPKRLTALAESMKGQTIQTRPAADIERDADETIRWAEPTYTPDTPARLKRGRPVDGEKPGKSPVKGVRLPVTFEKALSERLEREGIEFSDLVRDLLQGWMKSGLLKPKKTATH